MADDPQGMYATGSTLVLISCAEIGTGVVNLLIVFVYFANYALAIGKKAAYACDILQLHIHCVVALKYRIIFTS